MLTTLVLLSSLSPATASAAGCPVAGSAVHFADVQDPSLDEISGVVQSRRYRRVLWAHEDSGDGPRIYAMDTSGNHLVTYDVTGASAVDWEDMASTVEADGVPRLYVADIGDNGYSRYGGVTVWRFEEPALQRYALVDGATAPAERIDLTWPDGPRNAETLLVDEAAGELVIVSKSSDGVSDVMVAPTIPGSHVLQKVGTLQFGPPPLATGNVQTTGGAVAPDGSGAVIRTYSSAFYWSVPAGEAVADALVDGAPCEIPIPSEQQGEAIAFNRRGSALFTTSEGSNEPLWKIPLQ